MANKTSAVNALVSRGADVDDDTLAALKTTMGVDEMHGHHDYEH